MHVLHHTFVVILIARTYIYLRTRSLFVDHIAIIMINSDVGQHTLRVDFGITYMHARKLTCEV